MLVLIAAIMLVYRYSVSAASAHRNQSESFAQMMISIYITLGVFLLLAVRNPSVHRSLIAFTAWSSFAHGGVMAVQALTHVIPRSDLWRAVPPMIVIGVLLLALAPRKQVVERASAAAA